MFRGREKIEPFKKAQSYSRTGLALAVERGKCGE
jgi:hypothetical protein